MPLYLGQLDSAFIRRVNREFITRVVSQEVGYYKLSLEHTTTNIYGESKNKYYYQPVLITCRVSINPQENQEDTYGQTTNRLADFSFLKADLIPIQLVPEKGDIILWNESYYQVDNAIEAQLPSGKDPNYAITDSNRKYGQSLSIVCKSHLTTPTTLNLVPTR